MCLIIIAGKGTDKYSDFLINAIKVGCTKHKDGFGYGIKRANGTLYTNKGFVGVDRLLSSLKEMNITKEDELVVHLRMASAGSTAGTNTHPFELNYNSDIDISLSVVGRIVEFPLLFHNGTFFDFINPKSTESDTYNFANSFMKIKQIWNLLKTDQIKFEKVFKHVLGHNKLVFLSKETDIIKIGNFVTEEGYEFSNTSYKGFLETRSFNNNDKTTTTDIIPDTKPFGNTKSIKITENNYNQFLLKANCRSVAGATIEEGEYYSIKKFEPVLDNMMISTVEKSAEYKFMKISNISSIFTIIPKKEYAKKWIDFIKLLSVVPRTKSSVKKIFGKVTSIMGRRNASTTSIINIKVDKKEIPVRIDAVLLFLNEHKHFVDPYKLTSLLELSEPIKLTVNYSTTGPSEDEVGDTCSFC